MLQVLQVDINDPIRCVLNVMLENCCDEQNTLFPVCPCFVDEAVEF